MCCKLFECCVDEYICINKYFKKYWLPWILLPILIAIPVLTLIYGFFGMVNKIEPSGAYEFLFIFGLMTGYLLSSVITIYIIGACYYYSHTLPTTVVNPVHSMSGSPKFPSKKARAPLPR